MVRSLELDRGLILATLFLMAAGLTTIYSIDQGLFLKQLVWVVLGLILIFGLPFLNLKAIFSYRGIIVGIYLLTLTLLLSTLVLAPRIHGSRSWLLLSGFQIQPSEFMKAALIILLSVFFASRHVSIARVSTIIISFIYFIVPASLVLLQPDLGTALILLAIWFSYLLLSEIPKKFLVRFFLGFIILAFLSWNFILAPYQKERVVGLFNPNYDPLGVNYSVIESKIAIGSAGFFGKGLGQGSQVKLHFLPAAENDFIFSSFTEEWGFLGATLLIAAFMFLVYRILEIGRHSDNNFSRYLALGTVVLLITHFSVNVGSALGLLPVIGVPLTFVSYGGSNLLTASFLLGIILNTAKRRAGF